MESGRRARGTLEQEVVSVLRADAGPLTASQVRDVIGGELAYTTVLTVLTRLYDKGLVTRARLGRAYAYQPVRDEAELTARQMQRLLDARNDRQAVLSRFVGALSDEDEQTLLDLLSRDDPEVGR